MTQPDPRDVDALVEDAAMLMGLSVMATRLERDGFVNAAHYMRTGANRIISHATTITALQAEVTALREALEPFANAAEGYTDARKIVATSPSGMWPNFYLTAHDLFRARAALGQQP